MTSEPKPRPVHGHTGPATPAEDVACVPACDNLEHIMTSKPNPRPSRPVHGHTGPATPAEDMAREAKTIPDEEAAAIAEAASREEDA